MAATRPLQPIEWDAARQLSAARHGSSEAFGALLEGYRNYLLLIANSEMDGDLRQKCGASDLVQETFVRAQEHFAAFAGSTEAELQAWLRQILLNHCRNLRQSYLETAKRNVRLEVDLHRKSSVLGPGVQLSAGEPSPSGRAIASEEAALVADALSALPDEYQQVVRLRNWENLSFSQIGERMGRSAEAARKLWCRAILQFGAQWDASHGQSERATPRADFLC